MLPTSGYIYLPLLPSIYLSLSLLSSLSLSLSLPSLSPYFSPPSLIPLFISLPPLSLPLLPSLYLSFPPLSLTLLIIYISFPLILFLSFPLFISLPPRSQYSVSVWAPPSYKDLTWATDVSGPLTYTRSYLESCIGALITSGPITTIGTIYHHIQQPSLSPFPSSLISISSLFLSPLLFLPLLASLYLSLLSLYLSPLFSPSPSSSLSLSLSPPSFSVSFSIYLYLYLYLSLSFTVSPPSLPLSSPSLFP